MVAFNGNFWCHALHPCICLAKTDAGSEESASAGEEQEVPSAAPEAGGEVKEVADKTGNGETPKAVEEEKKEEGEAEETGDGEEKGET